MREICLSKGWKVHRNLSSDDVEDAFTLSVLELEVWFVCERVHFDHI
jgi:hypothetical protein